MKKITIQLGAAAAFMLLPALVWAQAAAPAWLDGDVRAAQYPSHEWYTDVAVADIGGDGVEKATARARASAVGNVSAKVSSSVTSRSQSRDVSVSATNLDEQVRSLFSSSVNVESATSIAGIGVETYHSPAERAVYAFAYIRRADLADYYQRQIDLHLGNAEAAVNSAAALAERGDKAKARAECLRAAPLIDRTAVMQDLLSAAGGSAGLQQQRAAALGARIRDMLNALESGVMVYVKCPKCAEAEGSPAGDFAEQVSGALAEGDCGCSIVNAEEDADIVLTLLPKRNRCSEAAHGNVFCYVTAQASVYNVRSRKTHKPPINEKKGGWTQGDYDKAEAEGYKLLVKEVAAKTLPYIKN